MIDHDHDATEISVGAAAGRHEARHLCMASVLLLNRDHVDEARPAACHLPDALDAWNPGSFEVVPQRSGPDISGAGGALMECSQSGLHGRRTDDNWIVAVIDR